MSFGDFVHIRLFSGHLFHECLADSKDTNSSFLQFTLINLIDAMTRTWALDGTWCSAMSDLTSSNSCGRGSLSFSPSVVSAHWSQFRRFSSSSWVASRSASALESLCWCWRAQAVTWHGHGNLIRLTANSYVSTIMGSDQQHFGCQHRYLRQQTKLESTFMIRKDSQLWEIREQYIFISPSGSVVFTR